MTTTTSETAVAAADGIVEVAKTERTTSIRLSRKALLVSLVEAKRFADVKSSMPILQTVMLRLRNVAGDVLGTSRLEVAATDLNMTYIDVVKVETTSSEVETYREKQPAVSLANVRTSSVLSSALAKMIEANPEIIDNTRLVDVVDCVDLDIAYSPVIVDVGGETPSVAEQTMGGDYVVSSGASKRAVSAFELRWMRGRYLLQKTAYRKAIALGVLSYPEQQRVIREFFDGKLFISQAEQAIIEADAANPKSPSTGPVVLPQRPKSLEQSDAVAICLDAKKLHDVVKALSGDEMTVEVVDKRTVTDETSKLHRFCVDCGEKVLRTKPSTHCVKSKDGTICGGAIVDKKRASTSTTTSALLCGKSKFKLTTLSGKDFPKLPSMDGLVWQTMPASTLAELIEGVAFSMSQDTTRAHLNGILLESIWHGEDGGSKVVADKIRVVSTDGHRLSKVDRPAAGFMLPFNGGVYDKTGVTSPKPVSILIPRDAVVELRRRCAKGVEAVDIAVKSGWLYCREVVKTSRSVPASLSTAVYILRLADAQFPPYEQVIPRDCHRHAVVATKDLVDTLKRLMLVASEKTHGMRLRFIETKGSATVLRIETDDAEGNKAEEDVDVAAGEFLSDYPKKTTSKAKGFSSAFNDDADTTQPLQPFIIGVNGEYVLQLLDKIETATTWIGMNNELDPLSFRPAQDEKPVGGDVFVVMPMRL